MQPPRSEDAAAGIHPAPWGERSFYGLDPSGNPICLVDDVRSETRPENTLYMGSPIAALRNVVLPTTSLGRAGAFYEELFGMDMDTVVPNRHFLRCESCQFTLVNPLEHATAHELPRGEFRPNPEIVYFAVDDLDSTFERAQKLRMKPPRSEDGAAGIQTYPWGERSFYGLDPSGNPICLVDDCTLYTGSG